VVVKPCDSRAVNVLLAESRIQRELLHVIGVQCNGIRQGAGMEPLADGPLQARCLVCSERSPIVYDSLVGKPVVPEILPERSQTPPFAQIEALENSTSTERLDFWLSQFDRCIRCYACRQACPMCDCPTCLYERDDSLWVGMGIGMNEKRAFHLGRAYHLAGRCVGCNECERSCPMEIPISLLNQKLAQEVQTAFGHRAGIAPVPSPFVTVLSGEESA
jgi:ferredoxin